MNIFGMGELGPWAKALTKSVGSEKLPEGLRFLDFFELLCLKLHLGYQLDSAVDVSIFQPVSNTLLLRRELYPIVTGPQKIDF